MNRRLVRPSRSAKSSSFGSTSQSSHGDSSPSGRGRSGESKISSAQIIWTHVVPDFDRALMTMSSARKSKSSQRALSSSPERYRTGWLATSVTVEADPLPIMVSGPLELVDELRSSRSIECIDWHPSSDQTDLNSRLIANG